MKLYLCATQTVFYNKHFVLSLFYFFILSFFTQIKKLLNLLFYQLHGNSVEGPFHVSETFRNRNLSETRGKALETFFLKISIWKLSGHLRFYFGNLCLCSGNARTFQLVMT